GYLVGQRFDRERDLVGIHDLALRSASVRFVAVFFGLLDGFEHRQRRFFDPLADIAGPIFIVLVVAVGARMFDGLGVQFPLAIFTAERQRVAVHRARQLETRAQVRTLETSDAVGIGAAGIRLGFEANGLARWFRVRALFLFNEPCDQRHPHRYTDGGLL